MQTAALVEKPVVAASRAALPLRWLAVAVENATMAATLGLLALFPVADMVGRTLFGRGLPGAAAIVQHLCLAVAFFGSAMAARENKLLALSSLHQLLRGNWKTAAEAIARGVSVAVASVLAIVSLKFGLTEASAEKMLVGGIPLWLAQSIIPAGFALLALRFAFPRGLSVRSALAALLLAAAVVAALSAPSLAGAPLSAIVFSLLAVAALCGAPIFILLAGVAAALFWFESRSVAAMPIEAYRLVLNPTLPAIPLFTLAGYLLAEGGASQRLIRLFSALVGPFRGGPAIMAAIVCALFTSFTGASGVTILALGSLLMPALIKSGYSERHSLGFMVGAGSLGLLLPPCLPLILYAIVVSNSGISIDLKDIFIAGVIPAFILVAMVAAWGIFIAKPADRSARIEWRAAAVALWEAKWELAIPLIALATLLTGVASPTESAAITACYALFVELFIYRTLKFSDLPKVLSDCASLVGGVLLILAVALALTNYFVDVQLPDRALEWVQRSIESPLLFLLALNVILLAVGCVMDVFSAIVVVAPIVAPIAAAFGIHPLHLAIIFLANLELGYMTPPVGMNLFLASSRFNKPMSEVIRASLPMMLIFGLAVLLITYVPAFTVWLPTALGGGK